MFGKLGGMMGKLQEMKQKADEIKMKLNDIVVKVEGAGGDIKIEITGSREIKTLTISEGLQYGNKQELEKQLLLALNKAVNEADKINESEMKKVASGLLPGL